MKKWIDLRSDTVTRPSQEMLCAMAKAEVGDDVYGEDPTVNLLEENLSEQVGMQAGLFVCSGTQSNLLAIMSHCNRGDEYIAGQDAHLYKWEGGGAAVLGSVQPQPVDFARDGTLPLNLLPKYIKSHDSHHARTKLLCLENTQGGKVLPLSYLRKARDFSKTHQLVTHLDGARVFNASVKLKIHVREITQHFDSVSICLSKGLGAPVGSVLCGSHEFIQTARRWRKVVGGGMRQAGILAAAGLYAIKNNLERLDIDHDNAITLANGLSQLEEVEIDYSLVQTNMVFLRVKNHDPNEIALSLKNHGILVPAQDIMRLTTHLDVSSDDIQAVIEAFKQVLRTQ